MPAHSKKARAARPEVVEEMKRREVEQTDALRRRRAQKWSAMGFDVSDRSLLESSSDAKKNTSKRQSWMTELPSNRLAGGQCGGIFQRGGKTQFRQRESQKVDSSWMDDPKKRAEKALRKQRADLMGIDLDTETKKRKRETSSTTHVSHARSDEHVKMQRSTRPAAHPRVPATWNRERDMAIGVRSQKKSLDEVKRSINANGNLGMRFARGR